MDHQRVPLMEVGQEGSLHKMERGHCHRWRLQSSKGGIESSCRQAKQMHQLGFAHKTDPPIVLRRNMVPFIMVSNFSRGFGWANPPFEEPGNRVAYRPRVALSRLFACLGVFVRVSSKCPVGKPPPTDAVHVQTAKHANLKGRKRKSGGPLF